MTMPTNPEDQWSGEFGEEWTERNARPVSKMDEVYADRFGVTRSQLMRRFIGDMDRDCMVLEVGANVGNQLAALNELGFENLYGIDIQREAIEWASAHRPSLEIVEGNVFDIPFERNSFDLVFTTGLLIHVPPDRIEEAMREIYRTTRDRIYGHEYYATEYTEIEYRGHQNLLWKADFPSIFLDNFDLKLRDVEPLDYLNADNVDIEFALELTDCTGQ